VQRPDPFGVGAVKDLTPVPPDVNEADVSQHAEMLRDRWLLQAKSRDDIADRPLGLSEIVEDVATSRFGNRVEDIGRRRGARHETIIFLYGNMSTTENVTF
jgi:hypothetical protein